jgi:predicted DNA-binding antitoxin AbrB/MazE fold protein
MGLKIGATYQDGILKPEGPLPLDNGQRVTITIHPAGEPVRRAHELIKWTGTIEDLDYLINAPENDPWEPA